MHLLSVGNFNSRFVDSLGHIFVSSANTSNDGIYLLDGSNTPIHVYSTGSNWRYYEESKGTLKVTSGYNNGQLIWNDTLQEFELDPSVDNDYNGTPFGKGTWNAPASSNPITKVWFDKQLLLELPIRYQYPVMNSEVATAVDWTNNATKILVVG